jgi:hypothetical protein
MMATTLQRPRFVPVSLDLLPIGVHAGDLLAVVPLERFRGDGVYVLALEGVPTAVRCAANRSGEIDVVALHEGGGATVMTHAAFGELLLGQVLATCKVLDRTLLEPLR